MDSSRELIRKRVCLIRVINLFLITRASFHSKREQKKYPEKNWKQLRINQIGNVLNPACVAHVLRYKFLRLKSLITKKVFFHLAHNYVRTGILLSRRGKGNKSKMIKNYILEMYFLS